jgi:cytochrome P450
LTIAGKEYLIPAHTHVVVNHAGVQASPLYWGSDAEVWRPDRWIVNSTKGNLESEEVITPLPGTFVPWSSGPRVCPGKKFAQVEFVAAVVSLFKNHEVRPVQLKGESQKATADRVKMVVDDSTLDITLTMKHPEKIRLIWEELA